MEKNYNNRQQQIELAIGKVQSELVAAKADKTAAGKARVPRYEHTVTALKEMQGIPCLASVIRTEVSPPTRL